MIKINKSLLAAPFFVAVLGSGAVTSAVAQQQEGLINVNVSDVDVGVIANVQVPVAIAANVCGVAVNVLARQLPGDVECDAEAQSAADSEQFMRFADQQGTGDAIRDALN
jgi:hypothetical protein